MTEIRRLYDEELPMYEDDTWAIPFKLFSQDVSLFDDFPDFFVPNFVEEVFARKEKLDCGSYQWVDIVGVTDSESKRKMLEEYFSQDKPERLFRLEFEFYLSFHNWVDPTKPFPDMILRLKEQIDALSLVTDWYGEGKLEIKDTDTSPTILCFLVTPDIFNEVLANPGIGYSLNDNQVATLAQNHYTDETKASFKNFQQN